MSPSWPEVSNQPSFPAIEEAVLDRWRRHDVFRASLRRREGAPEWTFYEGPPTANGRPGTHHVEARTFKDVFPRYRTMKGYHVRRKGGWDCHGLPVELEIEKELGLSSKADIERYGIAEFNRRCAESVTRYVDAWRELTERIGFWIDLDDAYWTMDPTYIDSLWWALKTLWDRGLIFEDHRVTPYCARCGTALSDAEVALGYRTVEDPSIYVRFPVTTGELAEAGASLLVWTTTPWTLPGNVAVAVNPAETYQLVESDGTRLVVAAARREAAAGPDAVVLAELSADELVGVRYEPPFRFAPVEGDAHRVVAAGFVTTEDGSGLVHIAPAFGAEDAEVARDEGLPLVNPVDLEGRFTAGPWTGRFVKDADPDIIAALRGAGLLVREDRYEHTYPFCWRCSTPLIYYAKPSWYIRTTAVRDRMLAHNATIDWHPPHIRDGRFGNWLEHNVDWALSRDRYWGTPLPFWRCTACGEVTVVGSRAELGERSGTDTGGLDPHRPWVDEVELPCDACGGTARRVPEVADAWFDSGGMPYAQWGYPYRGVEEFERHFPADFICEAIDQTRGWFYTLLAEGTLLFDSTAYRTVLCLGHIVDEQGRKMSKSLGNVLDPWDLIGRHGADALRWLMLAEGNPWVSRRVGHQVVNEVVRRFLLTLWNTHYFFVTYARLDGWDPAGGAPAVAERPAADRWALAELADTVEVVDDALARYDVPAACRRLERFVDDLSNWYVRRNRRRFWRAATEDPADKAAAYSTLHTCLVTLSGLLAPAIPFIADALWGDLVVSVDPGAPVSVHLTDFPTVDPAWRDEPLRRAMAVVRRLVEAGRQARTDAGVRVRQPLARAVVTLPEPERAALEGFMDLLEEAADELNVKRIDVRDSADTAELVERSLRPRFRELGPAFGRRAPRIAEVIRSADPATADRVAAGLSGSGEATLEVDGEQVTLTPGMVEVEVRPRTGWQVATQGPVAVAVDTTVTDELRLEGAVRELVRAVNEHRKALDLALDARIALTVDVPATLAEAAGRAGLWELLAREVLADELTLGPVADGVEVPLGELGTARVALRVR